MWSENKLNKKFLVVENAQFIATVGLTSLEGGEFDLV